MCILQVQVPCVVRVLGGKVKGGGGLRVLGHRHSDEGGGSTCVGSPAQ